MATSDRSSTAVPAIARRALALFAALLIVAAISGAPAGAHVTTKVGHVWKKHLRPLVLQQLTWTNVKGIPAGFADGVDNDTPGWGLGGNAGTLPGTNFLGTTDNTAFEIKVNGQRALRLEPGSTSPNLIGGFRDNAATAGVVGAAIGGGGASGSTNRVSDDYGTVAGGLNNRAGDDTGTTSDRRYATVGGGELNIASAFQATVGGGGGNNASGLRATIGGGGSNIVAGPEGTVGGGVFNNASGDRATIGGGDTNNASGSRATVGGGFTNTASGFVSSVGGGVTNTASGDRATIGGGDTNTASGIEATVGGGTGNTASGSRATVGGGFANTASGGHATVGGGDSNTAAGDYSFAAGRGALANHQGAFVWGDSTPTFVSSSANDELTLRASGGTRIFSNSTLSTGVTLAAGSGTWGSVSDRSVKRDLRAVDPRDVLTRLAEIPISTWSYEAQDRSIRHIGPMAQDFRDAFGVGEDERHITTIDADGVALAAIQGLNRIVKGQQEEIGELRQAVGRRPGTEGGPSPLLLLLLAAAVALVGGLGFGLGFGLARRVPQAS